jgi:hypothetical protein
MVSNVYFDKKLHKRFVKHLNQQTVTEVRPVLVIKADMRETVCVKM